MSSIFRDAEEMLNTLFDVSAEPVDYRRNGDNVYSAVPAKIGRTVFRTDDGITGAAIRTEEKDFIIRQNDIANVFPPQKGDEILFDGRLYMVFAPDSEPCWKWHTRQSHSHIRIHTIYIGENDE